MWKIALHNVRGGGDDYRHALCSSGQGPMVSLQWQRERVPGCAAQTRTMPSSRAMRKLVSKIVNYPS